MDPTVTPVTPGPGPGRATTSAALTRLTSASIAIGLVGLATGPLQARALGVEGRGDLAAVLVPTMLAGYVAHLGLGAFISREVARGRGVAVVLGSAGLLLAVAGVVAVLVGIPLSAFLGQGDATVRGLLLVGFAIVPLILLKQAVYDVNVGLQRWTAASLIQGLAPVSFLVVVVALYATDRLTVTSAALTSMAGIVLSVLPGLPALRGMGRPRVDRALTRAAVAFGSRAWTTELMTLANGRLDQFLMIPLVDREELGLYVVAVTVSQVAGLLTSAASALLLPRVAAGENDLIPRVIRSLLAVTAVAGVLFALAIPFVLRVLFGKDFEEAAGLAWLLLAAGVPLAGTTAASMALSGAGHPGIPAKGQLLSIGITIPGLLVALPLIGATGAALTSLVAYTVTFAYIARALVRLFGFSVAELLVVQPSDLRWLASVVSERLPRRGGDRG